MRKLSKKLAQAPVLDMNSLERPFLILMLILMYVSFAALGRDIFFNRLSDPTAHDPIGAHLNKIRFGLCILTIVTVVMSSSVSWAFSKVPMLFAPFALLAFVSPMWAIEPGTVLLNSVVLVSMWLALPMLMHRIGLQETVRISLYIIAWVNITSFVLAVFVPSIGTHAGTDVLQAAHAGRWRGIFAHKNGLGPWAAFGSVLLFTHSWLAGGYRLFWWSARVSAVACLIFAQSVTAILMTGFLAALTFVFYALKRVSPPIVVMICVVGLLAAAEAWIFFGDAFFELLGRDSSFSGRDQIWAVAIWHFTKSPLLGNGYLSLGGPEFLATLEEQFGEFIPGPESGILNLLLELGIVGFLTFFIPFGYAVRNGFEWLDKVNQRDRACIEFMLMVLVASLFEAITETSPLIATGGFDGVISFGALFALMTLPKSPAGVERSEAKLAKSWIKKREELLR